MLYLNQTTHFFNYHGGLYGFIPNSCTMLRFNRDMQILLQHFADGSNISDALEAFDLPREFGDVLNELRRREVLIEKACPDTPSVQTSFEQMPAHLTLFPTTDCNLRCRYCYAESGRRRKHMSWQLAQMAMSYFWEHVPQKVDRVSLSFHGGGEPTLRPDFLEKAWDVFKGEAKYRGLIANLGLVSNGAFGERTREWIKHELSHVNISFDGPQAVQDRMRPFTNGAGSFKVVTRNIVQLIAAGVEVSLRATISDETISNMIDCLHLAQEFGARAVQLEPCFEVGRGLTTGQRFPDIDRFIQNYLNCFLLGLEYGIEVSTSSMRCADCGNGYFCGATKPNLAVTPDGYITACFEVTDWDDPAAQVFFYGFIDENSGEITIDQDKVAKLRNRTGHNVDGCRECFMVQNCAGDCPVKAFRSSGSLMGRCLERCEMVRKLNTAIISMIADDKIRPTDRLSPDFYRYQAEEA